MERSHCAGLNPEAPSEAGESSCLEISSSAQMSGVWPLVTRKKTKHIRVSNLIKRFIDVLPGMGKIAKTGHLAMDPNEQPQISQDDNRALQPLKVDKNG
jgi:hypothetical protein